MDYLGGGGGGGGAKGMLPPPPPQIIGVPSSYAYVKQYELKHIQIKCFETSLLNFYSQYLFTRAYSYQQNCTKVLSVFLILRYKLEHNDFAEELMDTRKLLLLKGSMYIFRDGLDFRAPGYKTFIMLS